MINRVKEVIAKQLRINAADIKDTDAIIEDLGADSLDIVEMLMMLEDEYGITIPDQDAMKLSTIGDIVAFMEKQGK